MIGLFLGKGLEGCGVTKYAIEMMTYLKQSNIDYKLFIADDKKHSRNKSHDLSEFNVGFYRAIPPKRKVVPTFDDMINEAKECDTIVILSMPVKGYDEQILSETKRFFDSIKDKNVVVTHHNHSSLYMKKEVLLDDVLEITNTIFTHSAVNPVNKYIINKYPNAKIFNLNPSMFIDSFKKFWKPVSEIDTSVVNWIGRTTPWKGYDLAVNFHTDHLKGLGFSTSMHGMDRGPAFIGFKALHAGKFILQDKEIQDNKDNLCEIFGPYVQDKMLDKMSKSGFVLQLTKIKPEELQQSYSLEFTHIEALSIGSIPVFRTEHGNAVISRKDDRPIIEHDTGILWLNENNQAEVAAKMKEIANDPALFEEHRTKAYNFAKEQCDSKVVFDEFFRVVKEENSNLNKADTIGDEW